MKKLRWQLVIVVVSLAIIGVLLLSQEPERIPGVIEPVIAPTKGGQYSEALIGSMQRYNPLLDWNNKVDRDVDRLIFCSLIKFDNRSLPYGDLAESWGISKDGKVYNFSIRQDATWHDGKPVTSDDVIFTVNLLKDPAVPVPDDIREFWKQVETLKIDDKTIQFRLPEPFSPFMDYLTFGILPEHLVGDLSPDALINDPFNLQPVGCGPYRFDHLILDNGKIQGIALIGNSKYYKQPPYIDQVTLKYYPDAETAIQAYNSGDVMGISQIDDTILRTGLQEPNLQLFSGRYPRMGLIYLNLNNPDLPFFQESVVRRALLLGLNRQWIIDHIFNGQALLADGPIFPGTWASYEGLEHLPYDPETAIKMLKDAGYTIPAEGGTARVKEGQPPLAFELAYPDEAPYADVAQAIQRDWGKLGVQVKLKAVPYKQLLSDYLEPRKYQAALVDLDYTGTHDPDPYPFWHQTQITNGQNYAQWDDRQASEFLEQARIHDDYGERMKDYRNFQVRFSNEMPALPLYYPIYTYGLDQQVRGVGMGALTEPDDRFDGITNWFLEARLTASTPESPTTQP